jgi:hypothetical protein
LIGLLPSVLCDLVEDFLIFPLDTIFFGKHNYDMRHDVYAGIKSVRLEEHGLRYVMARLSDGFVKPLQIATILLEDACPIDDVCAINSKSPVALIGTRYYSFLKM